MSVTGEPGRGPVRPGLSLGDITAGLYCTVGVLSAIHERDRSGRGQLVDISMLDCQVAIQENAFMRYHITGELPERLGTRHPTSVPFQAFETKDGHLVIALSWGVPNQWAYLCAELGVPEIIDDPRFHSSAARTRNHAELEPILQAKFLTKTTGEWLESLQKFEIPSGPLNNIEQVTQMPQIADREMLQPVPLRNPRRTREEEHQRAENGALPRRPPHEMIDDRQRQRRPTDEKKGGEKIHGASFSPSMRRTAGTTRFIGGLHCPRGYGESAARAASVPA